MQASEQVQHQNGTAHRSEPYSFPGPNWLAVVENKIPDAIITLEIPESRMFASAQQQAVIQFPFQPSDSLKYNG